MDYVIQTAEQAEKDIASLHEWLIDEIHKVGALQFSKLAGVALSTANSWSDGTATPEVRKMLKIIKAFRAGQIGT